MILTFDFFVVIANFEKRVRYECNCCSDNSDSNFLDC